MYYSSTSTVHGATREVIEDLKVGQVEYGIKKITGFKIINKQITEMYQIYQIRINISTPEATTIILILTKL